MWFFTKLIECVNVGAYKILKLVYLVTFLALLTYYGKLFMMDI
jgi:hypothetical protein